MWLIVILATALLSKCAKAEGAQHNLPEGVELVDPNSLGLTPDQLQNFLGNVKVLGGGKVGDTKTQILTVGFDGDEDLDLNKFEIPGLTDQSNNKNSKLSDKDKAIAQQAFMQFKNFLKDPKSAKNYNEVVAENQNEQRDIRLSQQGFKSPPRPPIHNAGQPVSFNSNFPTRDKSRHPPKVVTVESSGSYQEPANFQRHGIQHVSPPEQVQPVRSFQSGQNPFQYNAVRNLPGQFQNERNKGSTPKTLVYNYNHNRGSQPQSHAVQRTKQHINSAYNSGAQPLNAAENHFPHSAQASPRPAQKGRIVGNLLKQQFHSRPPPPVSLFDSKFQAPRPSSFAKNFSPVNLPSITSTVKPFRNIAVTPSLPMIPLSTNENAVGGPKHVGVLVPPPPPPLAAKGAETNKKAQFRQFRDSRYSLISEYSESKKDTLAPSEHLFNLHKSNGNEKDSSSSFSTFFLHNNRKDSSSYNKKLQHLYSIRPQNSNHPLSQRHHQRRHKRGFSIFKLLSSLKK